MGEPTIKMYEIGTIFAERAIVDLPTASVGQIDAAYRLGQLIKVHSSQKKDLLLQEAVGGAGKSQLLQVLTPTLEEHGVTIVPDIDTPQYHREEHQIQGLQVATGRIFGNQPDQCEVIPVVGFDSRDITMILQQDGVVLEPDIIQTIGGYCLGSARLAKIMADELARPSLANAQYRQQKGVLARIAALYILDRVPRGEMDALGSEEVLARIVPYVPDIDPLIQRSIGFELHLLQNNEFTIMQTMLDALGCNPAAHVGTFNPVQTIIGNTNLTDHYPNIGMSWHKLAQQIKDSTNRYVLEKSALAFPIIGYPEIRETLMRILASGGMGGLDGVFSEPRIRVIATVPEEATVKMDLINSLRICLELPLQKAMRKTALAILDKKNPKRTSTFHISDDRQFFDVDDRGKETHHFFTPAFTSLEQWSQNMMQVGDEVMFFESGDHSKVPMVPSMAIALILQSILQQIGCSYVVEYIDERHSFDPKGGYHV